MKRAWHIRRDEDAVSPVIATILMVAITVVLAAVLYVMVSGLIAGPGQQAPLIQLGTAEPTTTSGQYIVSVDAASKAEVLGNFKVTVLNVSNGNTPLVTAPVTLAGGSLITAGAVTVSFTDLQGDTKLNVGDYFTVSGVGSYTYTLVILYSSTGNKITERGIPS
jgi:flagellin-like protein